MKKCLSLLLALALLLCAAPSAKAADSEAIDAANKLHELGLFQGTGTNADGTPNYDLDRAPTRDEAVTMLVRLLGRDGEASEGTWDMPFTDVADWAKPYVGYAYANKLTAGTSATTFGGGVTVTASQYLTFVLRALGYKDGADFQWDRAWELSDELGITHGEYGAGNGVFLRADVAEISFDALDKKVKGTENTLLETIKSVSEKPEEPEGESLPELVGPTAHIPFISVDGGDPVCTWRAYRAGKGTYNIAVYLEGAPLTDWKLVGKTKGVKDNGDGTLTVNYDGKDTLDIIIEYDTFAADGNGNLTNVPITPKSVIEFAPDAYPGLVLRTWGHCHKPDGRTFGYMKAGVDYYVFAVEYDGERITDYTMTSAGDLNVKVQPDGTLIVRGMGDSSITVTYKGKSYTFKIAIS